MVNSFLQETQKIQQSIHQMFQVKPLKKSTVRLVKMDKSGLVEVKRGNSSSFWVPVTQLSKP